MSAEGALRDRNQADFGLIETLRWEPAAGFVRLDRHLARLKNSARALGFDFSRDETVAALNGALHGQSGPAETQLRIRLLLTREGAVEVMSQPFAPLAPDAVWTLAIANTRLDSGDPLLRHKTTRRDIYDAARAEFSREEPDEVVLLNERGDVCEGTITSIFIDQGDGRLLTPALACGLLPGVLRGEMIDVGRAAETVLTVGDLRVAKAIFAGNSLRGLIRTRLYPAAI